MIESLALDMLLVLVLLLLVPIGMYRGGLREACSAAGLLLGYLVADAWSDRWGSWLADTSGISQGVARFGVAIITIVLVTAAVGYGAAAAFSSRPGPGGRLYGGLISLLTGIVFLGALIEFVRRYLHDGEVPGIIRNGYLSRTLAQGFDWVLLMITASVLLATLFGMLVRERDTEEAAPEPLSAPQPARRAAAVPARAAEPVPLEPEPAPAGTTAAEATRPVRIRQVRHWEDTSTPASADLQAGWSQTWPAVDRAPVIKGRRSELPGRSPRSGDGRRPAEPHEEDVLRKWLEGDDTRTREPRPQSDE